MQFQEKRYESKSFSLDRSFLLCVWLNWTGLSEDLNTWFSFPTCTFEVEIPGSCECRWGFLCGFVLFLR